MAVTNYDELNLALFEEANEQFNTHLNAVNNNRIIFSGKFGHGKTTFLRWFFDQEKQQKKYNVIRLFPVNYSVASNEDVFEYIKYDIIIEMLRNKYQVTDLSSSYFEDLPFFVKKNPLKVIALLVSMIPQVGKDIVDVMDRVDDLTKEFHKYHEQYKNVTSEGAQLVKVLEGLEEKIGSIYESNAITKLIETLLERQKEIDKKEETILIIDDLDRIDPEHIFRILNVFAAHFDLHTGDNKFGFDKVMVVCDIENIRNIFKAKYGADTDFNGYVDKFYSQKVFMYDIRNVMHEFALNILGKVHYLTKEFSYVKKGVLGEAEHLSKIKGGNFFDFVFREIVDSKELDLRNIVKWHNQVVRNTQIVFLNGVVIGGDNIVLTYTFIIRLLADVKGSVSSLKYAISRLQLRGVLSDKLIEIFNDLAYIYLIPNHNMEKDISKLSSYSLYINNRILALKFYTKSGNLDYIVEPHVRSQGRFELKSEDFKELLNRVIDLLVVNNQL